MTQQELLRHYETAAPGHGCTCPAEDCPLHGNYRVCVAWHRDYEKGPLPHCLRHVGSAPMGDAQAE